MGWFQDLISSRLENDEKLLDRAFEDLSAASGEGRGPLNAGLVRTARYRALVEILRYYRLPPGEEPEDERFEAGSPEELDFFLRPSGLSKRRIRLSGAWQRDASGPLLGELDGFPVALIPRFFSGYSYRDPHTGLRRRLKGDDAARFGAEAWCFYPTLPRRVLEAGDLLAYMFRSLGAADLGFFTLAGFILSVLGLILPAITNLIFNRVIPSGEPGLLFSVLGMLLGAALGVFCIGICRNTLVKRIEIKLSLSVQAAFMARILSLPAPFFRSFSAGETAERLHMADSFCRLLTGTLLPIALDLLFSCIFLIQISRYSPSLLLPALGTLGLALAFSALVILKQARLNRDKLKSQTLVRGFEFQLFNGIRRIRLQGGENRAFAQWARRFGAAAEFDYKSPLFLKAAQAVSSLIMLTGNILIYAAAAGSGAGSGAESGVSAGTFMAFAAAYGILSSTIVSLGAAGPSLAYLGPILALLEPLMKAVPEYSPGIEEGGRERDFRLSGNIELSNVSFRYGKDSPLILDNFSLKIRKGQYLAIVGKTGCGKSTLLRLLLGFEKPGLGSIYYDSRDLEKLDIVALRRNIGVVLQDGKLFQGSIYENIAISVPSLSLDEAWDAAERAGLAEDIKAMPMGMFTVVGDRAGLSGGQRQRLMIARAIAAKPRILILDEATSALDNITQKRVAGALEELRVTRIVAAHRLSTIRSCDRIILLDKGRIAGQGTYDELLAHSELFAELASRQRLDAPDSGQFSV